MPSNKFIDMTGLKISRLTCVRVAGKNKAGGILWECLCECGEKYVVVGSKLRKRLVNSCGCMTREMTRKRNSTHGFSLKNGKQQRLHRIWSNMKARCRTKSHFAYKNYGGRGIDICDEWFKYYVKFHEWAIANGYRDNLTIERINNNEGYSPSNCTWIEKTKQHRNQRNTVLCESLVMEIRTKARNGNSIKSIMEEYGISRTHASNVVHLRRWKSAPTEVQP
jgi:hypothetical protein